MQRLATSIFTTLLGTLASGWVRPLIGQLPTPAARWTFSAQAGAEPLSDNGAKAHLSGQWAYVPGLHGEVLRFDGYTTDLTIPSGSLPPLTKDGFTIETWVALNTYPWNRLPLADQEQQRETGYCLELDAFGQLTFGVSIDGQWTSLHSTQPLPLKEWAHVAATYVPGQAGGQLSLYLNGHQVARTDVLGHFTPASTDLVIGRVREATLPLPEAEIKPKAAIFYSLDGLLGEFTMTGHGLSSAELAQHVAEAKVPSGPVLPFTPMPSGKRGHGPFGAFYTGLAYEPAWDALRRLPPDSDVVVRFEDSPSRLVFWQGLNYVPAWVSGDDKWSTDEFLEVWDAGCPDSGDCEPMSDKQERFSHVRIVESNPVRAIVHWRYALAEVVGSKGAWPNARTGWTDWADEYWTVYPDGVAVRQQVLHSDHPEAVHEWQETIVLHQPGKRPEDDIAFDAVTLGNLRGEQKTFSWTPKTDHTFANPQGPSGMAPLTEPNMQLVGTKSAWKPFQIVPPQGATADFYNNEKSYSTFECWNHWPVAQIASSDRACVTSDRPSHSSLSHLFWQPFSQSDHSATKLLMDGLTTASLTELLPLARSWISPPRLQAPDDASVKIEYNAGERIYVLTTSKETWPKALHLSLEASESSPAHGAALLLKGWGESDVWAEIDHTASLQGKAIRTAHVTHLDGTDLLVWLPVQSHTSLKIGIKPAP